MDLFQFTTVGRATKAAKMSMQSDPKGTCLAWIVGALIAVGWLLYEHLNK